MKEDSLRIVLITAPGIDTARDLASKLVEARLAACVSMVPGIESVYRWEGKIENASEVLLLAKIRAESFDALEKLVLESHPYEVPEILALPADKVFERYLNWVRSETA